MPARRPAVPGNGLTRPAPPPSAAGRALDVVITCEHGGNEVPERYRNLFAGREDVLQTHRGHDAGALQLGRELADALGAPFFSSTTTRLLIDLNRSLGNRDLFSEFTADAPRELREELLADHYQPYREPVEALVDRSLAAGRKVFHLSSHSFTPVFEGQVRNADIGLLYDPRRPGEVELAMRWYAALRLAAPELKVRRNYPYTGRSDGFCAGMRRRVRTHNYIGLELEVNQRHVQQGGAPWHALRAAVVASLQQALTDDY
ncbi:MAG: N-formylglutamate amidohydrolase [Aromatoleum sp.]|jgi:predicted N-formylglutamate amidohydrolase|uniref:N-formylglutamate amidohydrolase n=1 Tax=Aromatoleum sp. TaxID=2307007 RepID=UPI00289406EB|nr:N-formylglutamate amidohydrolase [Aromatoleum sp.]MDT3671103.1 N-formylglutamate amidohydrolase [Aromatoleum sp.]